jgi:hypothetical protein
MKELKEILKVIDSAPGDFEARIPAVEKSIFRGVSLLLKDLKVSENGKIEADIENLKLINAIKAKLGKIVVSKQYADIVNKFVSNIPSISNLQTSTAGVPAASKKMMSAVAKIRIDNTLESLIGAGYKQEVVSKLYDTLLTNVTSGGSYADMIEQLENQLITTEKKPGMLSKYAKTYVVDALGQFAGQGNKMIADALKSEWFQYVGSNLTTTREFCEHMTKKRYVHISEFPAILAGEIDGHQCKIYEATGLPYGMKEGTDKDNFIENRGGWNCGHQLYPVSEAAVPLAVREKIKSALNLIDKQSNINIEKQEKDVLQLFRDDSDIPNVSTFKDEREKYGLSEAEIISVKTYTNDYYTTINKALREKNVNSEQSSFNDVLNRTLDKLESYEGVVYRGVKLNEKQIQIYKDAFENKKEHIEFGFTSTSRDSQTAGYFGVDLGGNVQIKILSKTGRNLDDVSISHASEQEILFKSGTKFKITQFKKKRGKSENIYEIEMEEL